MEEEYKCCRCGEKIECNCCGGNAGVHDEERDKDYDFCYKCVEKALIISGRAETGSKIEVSGNALRNHFIVGYDWEDSTRKARLVPLCDAKRIEITDGYIYAEEHPNYKKTILLSKRDGEQVALYRDDDVEKVQAHFEKIVDALNEVLGKI